MKFITDFADGAEIAPFVLACWVAMEIAGNGVMARRWVACVALVLGAMLGFKALCFVVAARLDLSAVSPSGHTASACIVYGGLAWLALRRVAWGNGLLSVAIPAAIVALIGVSRVAVGAHDWTEVVLGALIGGIGLQCLRRLDIASAPVSAWPIVAAGLLVLPVMHGHRLTVEKELRLEILGD